MSRGDNKESPPSREEASGRMTIQRRFWLGGCFIAMVGIVMMGTLVSHHGHPTNSLPLVDSDALLSTPSSRYASPRRRRRLEEGGGGSFLQTMVIYSAVNDASSWTNLKFVQDLQSAADAARIQIVMAQSTAEQKASIQTTCRDSPNYETILVRFQELVDAQQEHLATELYKYCALQSRGGIWMDAESPWMIPLVEFLKQGGPSQYSLAVLGEASTVPETIHGSFLLVRPEQNQLAKDMLQVMVGSSLSDLMYKTLLLPQALHDVIERQVKDTLRLGENNDMWYLLEQECHVSQNFKWQGNQCPVAHGGFCCRVLDQSQTLLLTRHALLPVPKATDLAKPYNAETQHYDEKDLPYISTIREQVFPKPADYQAKNLFDILMQNQCLPDSVDCARCLRNKSGANCQTCATQCACYCKALCKERPDPKHVAKTISVSPPRFARDPNRLVPRIIHQTYYEELTPDKYPNMSRMIESFKQSGWEYRFYSDEEAQNFLSTHFPPEVREAYDTLRPGAFKADLFRYCALLIYGGVYADVDIILESNLDASVPPDVGFMVPVDEPGIEAQLRMCVWNGLIASAPAHPFLAHVIETVVNQIRNRYTSVDVDDTFCPDPELSVLHAFDTLFTAGPCALGASINRVLGRKGQTSFEAGELTAVASKSDLVLPGRTIILHQNKWDMGGHRFTLLDQNLVVAATDLPDSDDRVSEANTVGTANKKEHYSKTHASIGIYGLEHLYQEPEPGNNKPHKAMETLQFHIVPLQSQPMKTTTTTTQ